MTAITSVTTRAPTTMKAAIVNESSPFMPPVEAGALVSSTASEPPPSPLSAATSRAGAAVGGSVIGPAVVSGANQNGGTNRPSIRSARSISLRIAAGSVTRRVNETMFRSASISTPSHWFDVKLNRLMTASQSRFAKMV